MPDTASPAWRIAVDIGGTFTDGVIERPADGAIWLAKSLTTPADPGEAVATVVDRLLAQTGHPGAAGEVSEVVHATTLVANAIIERKGGRPALLMTAGVIDTLDLRREDRYDLYDLDLPYPPPLVPRARCIAVEERIDTDGNIVTPLREEEIDRIIARLARMRIDAVAVCLLHAYAHDQHERRLGEAIRAALPGLKLSLSSEVAREIREYERASTTTANAYVQPVAAEYLGRMDRRLRARGIDAPLRIMVSGGGYAAAAAAAAAPIRIVESGPAAGVLSATHAARQAGIDHVLAFDMGGTTAKACVAVDGRPEITNDFEVGRARRFKKGSGLPILVPSVDLIEIGAGGGSIARRSSLGLLNVGPDSAGADPGPACYDQGGTEPTVTDADLLLGYLAADNFLGGSMRLSVEAARAAVGRLAAALGMESEAVAVGINDLVNETMAGAARVHIAEKGLDPRIFTMVATGGAGPVHAVEVAAKLGIRRVLCTIAAGTGSCLGLLVAPPRADRSFSLVSRLDMVDWAAAQARLDALHRQAADELGAAGAGDARVSWSLVLEMRYAGQGDTTAVRFPFGPLASAVAPVARTRFAETYERLYGRTVADAVIEIVTWRITGTVGQTPRRFTIARGGGDGGAAPVARRAIHRADTGGFAEVPVYRRYDLPPGTVLDGPAILQETESTIVVARPARISVLADRAVAVEL